MAGVKLDAGNRVTVTREPQQVVLHFVAGSSIWINMAITVAGAKALADELLAATAKTTID